MEKIFWKNPYKTELNTKVGKVCGNEILFAATIAYSFAGGQESDKAFINGIEILSSRYVKWKNNGKLLKNCCQKYCGVLQKIMVIFSKLFFRLLNLNAPGKICQEINLDLKTLFKTGFMAGHKWEF